MANASEGFIVLGPSGEVRVFNETAEDLLGISRGNCLGREVEVLGAPALAKACRKAIARTKRSVTSLQFNHGARILSCKVAPFDDDESGGVALVLRDDTELIDQQERSEAILVGVGDGLIVFTPDSRVTYVNPAAVEILGEEARKAVGEQTSLASLLGLEVPDTTDVVPCWELKNCGMLHCPQYGNDDLRCWLRCGTPGPEGAPQSYRDKQARCIKCDVFLENVGKLGEPGANGMTEATISEPEHRIVEVRTNPVVDRAGRYLGCVSTLHDVTAEREVAIMKNEFVSMVSHELRTPLTSIKGYVDLIVDGEAGEINEIQREFLEIVQENSDRLVSLINDLLDISRIESGRVHLKIEPIELPDIVQGVADTFRTFADQSTVSLSAHVAKNLPRAAADRDRAGQVLMNYVSNAIKYSPGGGSVSINVKRRGNFVLLEVTDTGIGISAEDQRQLFTKFFRVDSSLTREIGGTGLGLSICKSVVELMGGEVWVRSTEGKGSTFGFSLPVAPADLVRTPVVEGPLGPVSGTVLVVDHDPDVADLIETFLRKRGYDVVKALSAAEARKLVAEAKPVLITLDVMLDDVDGFELLQQLKDDPTLGEVPIVVLSIVCDEGKSLRLGAADYIEKPIDQKRLAKVVNDLIGAKVSPVALVVDDDRHIVDALSRILRSKGFAVAQAYDGREAMKAIEQSKPDLILLDLRMPVMDGYQVIQEVKSHDATKDIPIVVMTAHRIDHERIDILKLAAEHVSKPFSAEALVERVEQVLGGPGAEPATATEEG